jgi:hypothetical protein
VSAAQGPGAGTTGALDEVAGLVSRWRRARGSMDRVRVIASGARTLGSMSADDRRVLAQAVAERGAPEIADRIGPADGGGPSSSELTELTRALLSVDRAELDGLATSLGDPDERRRLLLAATGAVADTDAVLPPPPSGPAVPLPPPPDGPRSSEPSPHPPRRTEPEVPPLREAPDLASTDLGSADLGTVELGSADLGTADLGSAELGTAQLGTAAPGSVEPAPRPAPRTSPTRRRSPPRGQVVRPGPSADPEPPAAPGPPTPSGPVAEPGPAADPHPEVRTAPHVAPVPIGEVLDAVAHATSARGRLLAVARLEGAPLRAGDLEELLGLLPDGWQRRTAATRLLAAGGVTHPEPIRIVDAFARDSDRFVVAGTLVAGGLADPDALAAALTDGAARRLRRRTGR